MSEQTIKRLIKASNAFTKKTKKLAIKRQSATLSTKESIAC